LSAAPQLWVERESDVLVAGLSGELDLGNRNFVEEALREAFPGDASAIVIDLTGVSFLDSSAVEMLFALHLDISTSRRRMGLVVARDALIRRSIQIYDSSRVLDLYQSRQEALSALTRGASAKFG
jgi:anti-sigma B factor antagonist